MGNWPSRSTAVAISRSEEHTSELQSLTNLVCRLLLEKKKNRISPPMCNQRTQPNQSQDGKNKSKKSITTQNSLYRNETRQRNYRCNRRVRMQRRHLQT